MTNEHWRPGRKVLRTLYIHRDGAETGELVGLIDSAELASQICDAMNARAQADETPQAEVTDER